MAQNNKMEKVNWNFFLQLLSYLLDLLSSYILRGPQNFAKSPPYFCLQYIQTIVKWRFLKILWPSQNIWTLQQIWKKLLSENNLLLRKFIPGLAVAGVVKIYPSILFYLYFRNEKWGLEVSFERAMVRRWHCKSRMFRWWWYHNYCSSYRSINFRANIFPDLYIAL